MKHLHGASQLLFVAGDVEEDFTSETVLGTGVQGPALKGVMG